MNDIASKDPFEQPYDKVSEELLELAEVQPDWEARAYKFRCVSCKRVMQGTMAQLKALCVMYRPDETLSIRTQKTFRVPFLNTKITLTFWKVGPKQQPRKFIR